MDEEIRKRDLIKENPEGRLLDHSLVVIDDLVWKLKSYDWGVEMTRELDLGYSTSKREDFYLECRLNGTSVE